MFYLTKQYDKVRATWVCLLNNHDTRRWLDLYREEVLNLKDEEIFKPSSSQEDDALKIALFNMLSMPATPIIYAGDELGYYGTRIFGDRALREPIKWADPKSTCFFVDKRANTNGNKGYVLLTLSNSLKPAEERINQEDSIYKLIQKLCQIRKDHPELAITSPYKVLDPAYVVDADDDYSGVVVRAKTGYSSFFGMLDNNPIVGDLLFVFNNYKYKKRILPKISRNYYFKPLLLHKVKNNSWNIEIEENGYGVFELTIKSESSLPTYYLKRPRPK
ncbi:alpha amylase superfamily domain protein [Mycoplasmoides gallisepticum str. F]|uniref:alpha-amylase family glycosyl hydrolase n=1 Tax=Mycoplasmoides gallisepticum TaxID=2096 RepID=UPI0001C398B8|nr:alpha-amylase family glycosyl hydrolase [Mycoplasmoides gallisepticum]ADC31419.1 alpha amylase superfamily domain protein [Mycoplasmoides gallisepticum str. F]